MAGGATKKTITSEFVNSRLESRSAKITGLAPVDTTTEMTFTYSPLGEEIHRKSTTSAPPYLPAID